MKWIILGIALFAQLPATSNYQLNSYGFGSGGTANSTTSNYAIEGVSGEVAGQISSTANYNIKPGYIETQQANVPKITSFSNGGGTYYNKLHFVIDQQSNPDDALYALSISVDNFVSDTRYVKSDLTVGGSLSLADYQSYSAWGGSGGSDVIGLLPNTTYYLKVKATQGKFTESGYGPVSSTSTVNPSLSFSISTNSLAMDSLLAGTVVDAPSTIDITFTTNATSGGDIYISGLNGGLFSSLAAYTISSATADLTPASRGFGARVTSTSASSGTLNSVAPYDGSLNNVGLIDSTIRRIISTSSPVGGGAGSVLIKAKSASTDPAANDYSETITMLASASF